MSDAKEKGEISQSLNLESHVEWTVQDIFCDTAEDVCYRSPTFSVPGSEWYLLMYPNGETSEGSVGWIGLYLMRGSDESIPPMSVNYDFGVKKVDGTIELMMEDNSDTFDEKDEESGESEFLQRSKLSERKSELAPSGALTVTCTMRVKDDMDCTSRLIKLSNNFKNMFLSEEGSDVTLSVQDQEYPVHKLILASRSPVFQSMFGVDMKEKSTGIVDIVDCDQKAFNDFLVYMYSGQFQISSGDALELYKIAHKYCTEDLKSTCVRSILSRLSVDNVIDVVILGDQFDENELKSKSQDFFNRNFFAVVATGKWNSLLRQKPSLVNHLLNTMGKNTEVIVKSVETLRRNSKY